MIKVVCCTMYSPSHRDLANICVPNMLEYCQTHGYDHYIIQVENDKWEYKKHEAFRKLFEDGYDVIWYRDVDSLVTDLRKPITDFLDDCFSFYLTLDFNELNGGSVIIKNTERGKELNEWVLSRKDYFSNEQNIYNDKITFECFGDTITVLNHPSINQYEYGLYHECKELVGLEDAGDWMPGNFVIHFPGLALAHRVEKLKEYSQKVIR